MGYIRLNDIHATSGNDILEAPSREIAFTGGYGGGGMAAQFRKRLFVFTEYRLLDEHEFVWFQFLHQYAGHGLVHPAMHVQGNIQFISKRGPDGGNSGKNLVHHLEAVY